MDCLHNRRLFSKNDPRNFASSKKTNKASDYNLAGYNFKENKHVDAIGLARHAHHLNILTIRPESQVTLFNESSKQAGVAQKAGRCVHNADNGRASARPENCNFLVMI